MFEIRLFSHHGAEPYYNMAFDEWMFGRALRSPASVFLRLYTWQPGAITIGYNQNYDRAVDHSRLDGCAIIRRVTGGRALYHDPSEVTYSVAVGEEGFDLMSPSGSASEPSRVISEVLVSFLSRAGIESELVRRSSASESRSDFFHKAPCFASFSRYEIASRGSKVVASAQRRIGRTIFQHGSIKICGVAAHPALAHARGVVGQPVEFKPLSKDAYSRLKDHFRVAFESFLGMPVFDGEIGETERKEVAARCVLVRKYFDMRRDIF